MTSLTILQWRLTDWPILVEGAVSTAALLTALTVIYRKALKPLRALYKSVKALVVRANKSLDLVEFHFMPNHGSSLVDKVNSASLKIHRIEDEMSSQKEALEVLQNVVSEIKGHVVMLLEHDETRDQMGLRYGPRVEEIKEVLDAEDS